MNRLHDFCDWLLGWLLFLWAVMIELGFNPPIYMVFLLLIGSCLSILIHMQRYYSWLGVW